MRVIISGGGTGGHIFPAIAIANTIKQHDKDSEILFVGAKGRMEMQKVPQAGYDIIGLHIAGFNRQHILKNFSLPFKLIACLLKCRKIIKSFKPDVVIGVGGYASFSIVNMAQKMNVPTILQEQNSLAGKSNQILGKKAKKICVAYDNMQRYFPSSSIVLTGNPVRKNILDINTFANTEDNQKSRYTVLVTGGSLGARTINIGIERILQYFIDKNIELIWQTGSYYYKDIIERTKGVFASNPKARDLIQIQEFIFDMGKVYSQADIIIARAGALSISELCIVGKPTILIPSPNVAEDHQTKNATSLVDKHAAIMIKDKDILDNASLLSSKISSIIEDKNLQKELKENIHTLAIKDATEKIFDVIVEVIDKNKK